MNGDDRDSNSLESFYSEIKPGVSAIELGDCYILSVCEGSLDPTFRAFAIASKAREMNGWAIDAHSIRTNTFGSNFWIVATFHRIKSV